ncbi:MAG: hypothetical protein U9O65_06450 [Thermotogota bacterium]|nr:hypothetical protein [Thermotogota bacterium]
MEYVFTDWDNRSYKRKSKEKISIEAEHISSEQVKILLKESGKSFVDLILSRKEAAAIINALSAANSECKCIITM